jgi:hypothetical protein
MNATLELLRNDGQYHNQDGHDMVGYENFEFLQGTNVGTRDYG